MHMHTGNAIYSHKKEYVKHKNNNKATTKWSTTISIIIIRLQLINKSKRKKRRRKKNFEIDANEKVERSYEQVRKRMRIFAYFYRFLSMFG